MTPRPGLDADIATLRNPRAHWMDRAAAANRVEAELSRLREERDEHAYYRKVQQTFGEEQYARAEAAEARCARLQQALEAIANDDTPAFRNEMGQWAERWERHEKVARQALAGPGSEQSSLTESGVAGLPDTPADSPKEACPGCGGDAGDNHFDRSLCPCGDGSGTMHTYCNTCGYALDGCGFQPVIKPEETTT